MRTLIVILFFVVVVAQAHAETLLGRAIWIHDGDTVTINAKNGTWFKVRLWGIDAPELDQPGGKEAMLELIQLIGRKTVTVSVKDRDRYGRIVGVITYRNRDINREMIQLGYALYYKQYAPNQKVYADAEQTAKEKKEGLWKSENPPIPPWEWRKMKRKKRAPRLERPEDNSATLPRSSRASCGSFFSSFRVATALARLTCLQPPEFPCARRGIPGGRVRDVRE